MIAKNKTKGLFPYVLAGSVFISALCGILLWFLYSYPKSEKELILLLVFLLVTNVIFWYILIRAYYLKRTKSLYDRLDHELFDSQRRNSDNSSQLDEIERLKMQENYRRDFLGNVSHELKTPIFNLQGYLDTLLNGGLSDPNINRSFLQKASKNVDRLQEIVEDLLLISKYESEELKLNNERFDIRQLILEEFETHEMLAQQKMIHLRFKPDAELALKVFADKQAMRQVIDNLLGNAIKYSFNKGNVWVGVYELEDKAIIEITDDGPGISDEHLPRLFERFYRVDRHRSREKGGTGLGLSIVKHIIEAHKQNIKVQSKLGEGTTFSFSLPLAGKISVV